ncbi:rod shape-determining protein MreD [Sediminibacterium goheungense]|uniref:Rod shape-determining protein MreD n=1 Tax=Sediminibacterium goheungense TaxID=1086393 RepID=A0A4R6J228_9BACT|nr:rod shape-determining protein MreD [Sediminibacterium goheungense]TDO28937.1 rod shape-determining protein MreD [Sediminibacterium goheungense]
MSSLVKNIIRFILFILLQVFILNEVPPLHRFIVPYIYFLYILWLPFTINRIALMLIAFAFGLSLDFFSGTTGLHAAPCVLIAYIRPFLLNLILPQETIEQSYSEPGSKSMGWAPYSLYVGLLTFIHHFYLVLIEWLTFGDFLYFLGKVLGTTAVSLLMIFLAELLFLRKGKYRTNAA